MITVVLQIAVAVTTLGVGLVCAAVARRLPGTEHSRGGWVLAATAFVLLAVSGIPHATWAAWAYLAGPGTAVYESFLRWSSAGNYGRNILMIAAGVLLALQVFARRPPRPAVGPGWVGAVLTGTLVAGTAVATTAEELPLSRHYLSQSVLQLAALVLFLASLLGAAVRGTLDRLLWLVLGLYALHQAVSILWHAANAWWNVEGGWSTPPQLPQLIYLLVWIGSLALALRRLRLARSGTPVPALLEAGAPRRTGTGVLG